jgi:hypothetical protein
MRYPEPFWPGHFGNATWIGLLNWYVLRRLWLRLFCECKDPDINPNREICSWGLLFCSPSSGYAGRPWKAKTLIKFEVRT